MDLSNPIRSVIPMSHGEVLAVLARTDQPLSGRRIAELTNGRLSQKGANLALRALVRSGLVLVESRPPAKLHRLNRNHLAAASIERLVALRERLIAAMIDHISGWKIPAPGAWLFGSAARGDGDEDSDIDVLVLRPDPVDENTWDDQVELFADMVLAWAGNRCAVIEYTLEELVELMSRPNDRLATGLLADAIELTSARLPGRQNTQSSR